MVKSNCPGRMVQIPILHLTILHCNSAAAHLWIILVCTFRSTFPKLKCCQEDASDMASDPPSVEGSQHLEGERSDTISDMPMVRLKGVVLIHRESLEHIDLSIGLNMPSFSATFV